MLVWTCRCSVIEIWPKPDSGVDAVLTWRGLWSSRCLNNDKTEITWLINKNYSCGNKEPKVDWVIQTTVIWTMSLQLEVKELASYVQRNKILYYSAIAKHPRTFNSLKYRKYWPHTQGVSTNDFSNITGLRRGPHDIGTQIYYCKVFGGEAAHSYTGVAHSLTDFGKTSVLGKNTFPVFSSLIPFGKS